MSDIRQTFVDAANSVLGLTAPDPNYLTLIDPGDDESREEQVAKESDCVLVSLGIEEIALSSLPARTPYKDASAFNVMYERAGGNPWKPGGAFRLVTLAAPPGLGDVVEYGDAPGAPAHMETLTGVAITGSHMTTKAVAGGERAQNGNETVAEMSRTFFWTGQHWVDNVNHRPILGVVDCELLAAMYPVIAL